MKRFAILTAGLLLPLGLGCQRADNIGEKLDEIQASLKSLEQKLGAVGARGGAAPQDRRPRPDPADVFSVSVADAPFKGAKDAKVTVVKAFEFACPYCEKAAETMDQLLADYKGDIKVAYKHYVVHPQTATDPAKAACAAGEQGKFAEMEKILWEKAFQARKFDKEHLATLAKEIGLDMGKYNADVEKLCAARVQKDQEEVGKVGTTGTPAFYINGRFLSGARPVDQFKVLVDEELKKANERISKGEATVANYYDKFVVEKGKKSL